MKKVSGFVRSKENGAGVQGVNVTILDDLTGQPIPGGGVVSADANPVVTDVNGYFEWETELSPGPIRLVADAPGAEVKVRSGKETMQVGDVFLSDLSRMLRYWTFGVVKEDLVVDPLMVQPVTGQRKVRVLPGMANMRGYVYQLDADRIIDIDPNTTLANRIDLIVLEQHVAGVATGRQSIGVIKGTVTGAVPATNADPNIFQMPIGRVTIPQGATSVTVTDVRIFSTPSYTIIGPNSVGSAQIIDGSVGLADLSDDAKNGLFPGVPAFDYSDPATPIAVGTGTKALYLRNSLLAEPGSPTTNLLLGVRPGGVKSSHLADGSVTIDKLENTLKGQILTWILQGVLGSNEPVVLRGRNDTNQDYSNTSTILTVNSACPSGTYRWMAFGSARITGLPYQGSLLNGWLRIMEGATERGAEAFYMPGWVDDGDSVVVFADGTFTSTGSTPTFSLQTIVDGGGTLRVNQRQIMVWAQRVS